MQPEGFQQALAKVPAVDPGPEGLHQIAGLDIQFPQLVLILVCACLIAIEVQTHLLSIGQIL